MASQECALYGELVRHLRDKCVVKISEMDPDHDAAAARVWIDGVIREWLFTPNEETLGSAPREIIWRERDGKPNLVPPKHAHEPSPDECPTCDKVRKLGGEEHWRYDDGGAPLVAEYDPQGAEAAYGTDAASVARWKAAHPNWQQEMKDEAERLRREAKDEEADAEFNKLFGLDTDTDENNEN